MKLEIKTCVGIGDFILTYSILEQIKHRYSKILICPDYHLLTQFRSGSEESYEFTRRFAKELFHDPIYELIESSNVQRLPPEEFAQSIGAKPTFISSDFLLKTETPTNNYIIINTKVRHCKKRTVDNILKKLPSLIPSDKQVVLMGERNIGCNKEAEYNLIYTIYDELKGLFPNCLDLTKEILLDKPNYENLLFDLAIMRGASLNIGFGVSGTITLAASIGCNFAGIRDDDYWFITSFFEKAGQTRILTRKPEEFFEYLRRLNAKGFD